jgi:hypothetical protein
VMNTNDEIFLDETEPLLTPEDMAKATNLSVGHLANLRCRGLGPDFIRLGDGPRAPIRYLRRQKIVAGN